MILQGENLEAYKGFDRTFLPHVGEQAYGTRGQTANSYWHKYNVRKVLSFIVIENSGST